MCLYSSQINRLAISSAYPPTDTIMQLLVYSPRFQQPHGMFPRGNPQGGRALLATFEHYRVSSATTELAEVSSLMHYHNIRT